MILYVRVWESSSTPDFFLPRFTARALLLSLDFPASHVLTPCQSRGPGFLAGVYSGPAAHVPSPNTIVKRSCDNDTVQ